MLLFCEGTDCRVWSCSMWLDYKLCHWLLFLNLFLVLWIFFKCRIIRLIWIWLGEIWENSAVETYIILLHMILILCPVEKDTESWKLLETFCMPAWSTLAHLIEYIVNKCCSWAVHTLICCFITFVLTLNNTDDFSIWLLLENESICSNCQIGLCRHLSIFWSVLDDAWWDMTSNEMVLIIWRRYICDSLCWCHVWVALMTDLDTQAWSRRGDWLLRWSSSWRPSCWLIVFAQCTGRPDDWISKRSCCWDSCLFRPNTLVICDTDWNFFCLEVRV